MKSNDEDQELLENVPLNEFLDPSVNCSDSVRASIAALSEVAVLRALNKDRQASLLAFHARRKGNKKAILQCRLEQSYLDFLDAWGAKRGIDKRSAALRAILDAAQEQE